MRRSGFLTTAAVTIALGGSLAFAPVASGLWGDDAAFAQGNSGKDKEDRGGGRDKEDRGGGRDKEDRGRSADRGGAQGGGAAPGQAKKAEKAGQGGTFIPPGQAKKAGTETATGGGAGRVPPGQAKKATATEQAASTDPALEDTVALDELDPKGKNIRAQLGALNAAHANENALRNASPNSRVGRIAAYRDEVLAGRETAGELEEARELLETLDAPEREIGEIRGDLRTTRDEIQTLRDEIAELELAVEDGTADQADLDAARDDLRALRDTRRELRDELTEAQDYADAELLVDELEEEILLSVEESTRLLDLAANKPVTDEVEDEVQRLLGLDGDPLAEIVEDVVTDAEIEEVDPDEDPIIIVVE